MRYYKTHFCFAASGQKLIVINKRGNSSLVNKSQTLPRSMGSRATTLSEPSRHQRLPIKPATTPPVVRRQFSVKSFIHPKVSIFESIDLFSISDYWITDTQINWTFHTTASYETRRSYTIDTNRSNAKHFGHSCQRGRQ